ncbi:MAG: STM4014 family protein [Mariniblastus sp.]
MSGNFILIANPENRRVRYFQEALFRLHLPPAIVVSYEELLSGQISLASVLQPDSLVRIESPGENFSVEKLLLHQGAAYLGDGLSISHQSIDALENDLGLIRHPRQWFLGYLKTLSQWEAELTAFPDVRVMNWPSEIATMFDKIECQQKLADAEIPVPMALGVVRNYQELLARMAEENISRVFVKIANGSSASGVVAFEVRDSIQRAITSVELVRSGDEVRLYNSLRVRTYIDQQDIGDLIDTLCREAVHVESWFEKASFGESATKEIFDLRVVVIGGRAQHVVVRQSKSPMTNLHLGNRRGDLDQVKTRLGSHWSDVMTTCEKVMTLFPGSHYAGIDVAIGADFCSHTVLEVNAFGDLLPNVEFEGVNTYESEIKSFITT